MAASSVDLPTSFQRHPPAENKSVRTAETYLKAVQQLDAFLRTRGIDLAAADRDDEELLRRLLATCAGRDFEARRDRALILLLLDTGGRRAEIGGMRLGDVDFEYDVVLVVGKGGRERALPFGNRTGKAIDQYLRARARHPHADLEWFWIGLQGARNRLRHRVAPSPPGSGSRNRKSARPPSSLHLRPSLARPGWRRNRPHAVGGLDVSGDATAPRSPTSAPARPIGAFRQQTGCFH
jgi:integrase